MQQSGSTTGIPLAETYLEGNLTIGYRSTSTTNVQNIYSAARRADRIGRNDAMKFDAKRRHIRAQARGGVTR